MKCTVVSLSVSGVSAARHFQTPQEAILETFKEDIMKTQARKTKKVAKLAELPWFHRAKSLPLALYHTTIGPIIGRVDKAPASDVGSFKLRLWAPAAIRMGYVPGQPGTFNAQYSVTFQPIALVETYLDLSVETPFGRSPVPEALVPAYEEYFAKAAAGEYSFARKVAHVEQAAPHGAMVEVEVAARGPIEVSGLPWPSGSDPHTWLTRKVYGLDEDEAVGRDDPRRVLVKRAFFGWAYNATAEKVAKDFDFDPDDVRTVYEAIDEEIPAEDQAGVKTFLNRPKPINSGVTPDETDVS
jgi:hypothetical protein